MMKTIAHPVGAWFGTINQKWLEAILGFDRLFVQPISPVLSVNVR